MQTDFLIWRRVFLITYFFKCQVQRIKWLEQECLVPVGESLNNSQTLLGSENEYKRNQTLVDHANNANNTTVTVYAISENIQGISEQNEKKKLTYNKINCYCQKEIQQLQH